eukprot:CAMPEP_0178928740 /NCGR_PEP_ID=MMETSP0786-20121207/20110_1 /TAXON_ID=186022 /ORGANISM="Thalassionema frauenfeldii, Strain CCMP 1798" /LENGTH=90 /DNA_ID=CAMNT_0020604715 /DNA_START=42 /DNA_END=314 /DNA_ORIENTATION=+
MATSSTSITNNNSSDEQSIREMSRSLRRIKRRMLLQTVHKKTPEPVDKLREMLLSLAMDSTSSSLNQDSTSSLNNSFSSLESVDEEEYYD